MFTIRNILSVGMTLILWLLFHIPADCQRREEIRFTVLKQMPRAKYGMATCSDGQWIYCFGGAGSSHSSSGELMMYNIQMNEWFRLSSSDFEKRRFANCVYNGLDTSIYVLNGVSPAGLLPGRWTAPDHAH